MRLTNKGVMFEQLKSVSPSAKSGYLSLVDIDDTELLISETEIMRMCDVVNHKRLEWSISGYLSPISKDEFKSKYCDVEMLFYGYSNYSFEYQGIHEGDLVICYCGGDANRIGDIEVTRDYKEKLHTLNAYCAEVYHNNTMVEWFER